MFAVMLMVSLWLQFFSDNHTYGHSHQHGNTQPQQRRGVYASVDFKRAQYVAVGSHVLGGLCLGYVNYFGVVRAYVARFFPTVYAVCNGRNNYYRDHYFGGFAHGFFMVKKFSCNYLISPCHCIAPLAMASLIAVVVLADMGLM
jgi:hypothetical protein